MVRFPEFPVKLEDEEPELAVLLPVEPLFWPWLPVVALLVPPEEPLAPPADPFDPALDDVPLAAPVVVELVPTPDIEPLEVLVCGMLLEITELVELPISGTIELVDVL